MNVKKIDYKTAREEITSGDLLAWSVAPDNNWLSNILLTIIKFFTSSKIGHVGIAWKTHKRLLVVEATIPFVKAVNVSKREKFYWIPVNTKWTSDHGNHLLSYLGCSYSVIDCINAYFGITHPSDARWQCAELCNDFYDKVGIPLLSEDIPNEVVEAALKINGGIIYLVED